MISARVSGTPGAVIFGSDRDLAGREMSKNRDLIYPLARNEMVH